MKILKFLVLVVLFVPASALADGFRPETELASTFADDVATAKIAVFPTIVRNPYVSRYSTDSSRMVVEFLETRGLGTPEMAGTQFYLGDPEGSSQFEFFENALQAIGEQVASSQIAADYVVVVEVLFPPHRPGVTEVFGIHVYVLTSTGENAFSFLLNSHHDSFANARLSTRKDTARSREKLAIKATSVATKALEAQIAAAQDCAVRRTHKTPTRVQAGKVDDFESGLAASSVNRGIPIGFSTFSGDKSRADISVTTDYPPLPVQVEGRQVLKLDLKVKTWAGVLHSFESETLDEWVNYDWRGSRELSFWLYGRGTGTTLVVDVLDNRRGCSAVDDAERYSYSFVDNFSGWKLISIPFEVMLRKEIGNGAPNDGLGLSEVHGWGLAALKTRGKVTYYIDDVSLRTRSLFEELPEGLSREDDIWSPVNDLPMYGEYEQTDWQVEADEKFIRTALPDFEGNREAAAEHFARVGWNLYYQGDKSTAIKRFNQAWLLHPRNQNALWGFAVISRERGKTESAVRYYEMALESGPEDPKLKGEADELLGKLVD